MKYVKCLKIAPETICEHLRKSYQPVTISEVELNLNELAASLIESLMERMITLENNPDDRDMNEQVSDPFDLRAQNPLTKKGRLLASYLIVT